jgi:asparagine synthetase B (glutamine-hydrolysing)
MSYNALIQPIYHADKLLLFNGEIYNGGAYIDGDNIGPAYENNMYKFPVELDGEYAIAIFDKKSHKLILATDQFATKPLHFGIADGRIVVCSYASSIIKVGLRPRRVAANTLIIIDTKEAVVSQICHPYEWKLSQVSTDLEQWSYLFEKSMDKRIFSSSAKIYFGLSGGYDSGIMSSYLAKKSRPELYLPVSIINPQEAQVQFERLSYFPQKTILAWSDQAAADTACYANDNIEYLDCIEYSTGTGYYSKKPMIEDSGFNKLIYIGMAASNQGCKIFLDGMGGDEIYADYGWNGKPMGIHSNFGGLFPDKIKKIIPKNPYFKNATWASFYNSTMSTYLAKSEHVVGSFGQESRYPLLDRDLVECFLNLPSSIKNMKYKSPMHFYMKKCNWPMIEAVKYGF